MLMPEKKRVTFDNETISAHVKTLPRLQQVALIKKELEKAFDTVEVGIVFDSATLEQLNGFKSRAEIILKTALELAKSIYDAGIFQNECSESEVKKFVDELVNQKIKKLVRKDFDCQISELVDNHANYGQAPEIVARLKKAIELHYSIIKLFGLLTDEQIDEFRRKDAVLSAIVKYLDNRIQCRFEKIEKQNPHRIVPEGMLALCNRAKKEIVALLDIQGGLNPTLYPAEKIEIRKYAELKKIDEILQAFLFSSAQVFLQAGDGSTSKIVFFTPVHSRLNEKKYSLSIYAIKNGQVAVLPCEKRFASSGIALKLIWAIETMLVDRAFSSVQEAEEFFSTVTAVADLMKDNLSISGARHEVTQLLLLEYKRLEKCGGFAAVRAEATRNYSEAQRTKKIKSLEEIIAELDDIAILNLEPAKVSRDSFFSIGPANIAEMQRYVREIIEHLKDSNKRILLNPQKPVSGALKKMWDDIEKIRGDLVSSAQSASLTQ